VRLAASEPRGEFTLVIPSVGRTAPRRVGLGQQVGDDDPRAVRRVFVPSSSEPYTSRGYERSQSADHRRLRFRRRRGIQADLKTFSAFRVFGMSVITAVTAQNSLGVQGIFNCRQSFVGRQIDSVLSDFDADAVKIGMLSTAAIIGEVAERLRAHGREGRIVLVP